MAVFGSKIGGKKTVTIIVRGKITGMVILVVMDGQLVTGTLGGRKICCSCCGNIIGGRFFR